MRLALDVPLLVALAALAACTAPGPTTTAPQAEARQRLVLENFDTQQPAWHAFGDGNSGGAGFRLRAVTNAEQACAPQAFADVKECTATAPPSGKVLHLEYAFQGRHARAAGVRFGLSGIDATRFDHLSFWIRGDRHPGFGPAIKVQLTRPDPKGGGLTATGSYVVTGITDRWRRLSIPLNFMTGIDRWSQLDGFVILVQARRGAGRTGAYELDQLSLVRTGDPGPSIHDPVVTPKKVAWEAAHGHGTGLRRALRARLRGWPSHALVDPRTLPAGDRAFLERLARDTWRGIDALTDAVNGLPVDNLRFPRASLRPGDARIGAYTSTTNVGMYLASVVAARDLGLITDEVALARLRVTLTTLEHLERWRGFYYNYYDTTTLERTSNFVSFVDSAWLTAGLMVVRNAFPVLRERCSRLIDGGDYGLFYDQVEQQMSHGWWTNLPARSEYHYGLLYTESRLGSLIAIGKGDVPEEHWFRMQRTLPSRFAWQTQEPVDRRWRTVRGYEVRGGHYAWQGLEYVPSWGGSMFEALMPTLLVDEQEIAPAGLGRNDAVHVRIQRRYATEALGYPVWGMSPSARPGGDDYAEYGVPLLGTRGYPPGVVTPHATTLALPFAPAASSADLRALATRYRMYGEYGLYDAVDPVSGRVAYKYLALDQSMLFIALANHLRDHCVQRRFAADPIARRALSVPAGERFTD